MVGRCRPLRPGTSALVLYGRSNPGQRPELVRRLVTFNPKILESDLPADLEQAFNESLERAERAPRVVG